MLSSILTSGTLGFLYYLIIHKISSTMISENLNNTKTQLSILFLYFSAIFGIVLGIIINKYNTTFRLGMYFGASLLLFSSMITNWDNMDNQTKLLLLGINFGIVVMYCAGGTKKHKKKKHIK